MEVPSKPWNGTLGIELFLHNSNWYLLVVENYSEFPLVQKLSATSTKDMISTPSFCFSGLGTPEEVM